jgi:acetyltransferase (GNAT) family protein
MPDTGDHVPVGKYSFALRRATPADWYEVRKLVHEAAEWLQTCKDTDQWAKPWPTREARDQRVFAGLERGKTWIVWDGDVPAATVTIATRPNATVWSNQARECDLSESAVYAHRLITARDYADRGLGAELLDWTGLHGRRLYGARWIRIDVWSTNKQLHDYYLKSGFEPCGFCADPSYPSGALFQKPVSAIRRPDRPQFAESSLPDLVVSGHYDRRSGQGLLSRSGTSSLTARTRFPYLRDGFVAEPGSNCPD